jgi:DNA-binding LytR/AlgR family response regulator
MPMPVFDSNNEMQYVEVDEVIDINKESSTRRIIVNTECGDHYIPSTIAQIAEIMNPLGFHQINSNQIINLNKVEKYEGGHYPRVTVSGVEYVVSRDRKKGLEARLNENDSRNKIR